MLKSFHDFTSAVLRFVTDRKPVREKVLPSSASLLSCRLLLCSFIVCCASIFYWQSKFDFGVVMVRVEVPVKVEVPLEQTESDNSNEQVVCAELEMCIDVVCACVCFGLLPLGFGTCKHSGGSSLAGLVVRNTC